MRTVVGSGVVANKYLNGGATAILLQFVQGIDELKVVLPN
jgi:hypothetical protein